MGRLMDGWMHGRIDRWDGSMLDAWIEICGWIHAWMQACMDGRIYALLSSNIWMYRLYNCSLHLSLHASMHLGVYICLPLPVGVRQSSY